MNLEPVLSQFTVEDLEDANMALIHRDGLPRFREDEEVKPEDDDSTIMIQDDLLQVEDMGEWLDDAEASVERVSIQLSEEAPVEIVEVSSPEKRSRRALAVLEVTETQKTEEEKLADECRGAEVCAVMMEVLGLEDDGELKMTKEARANLVHKNKVTDRTYNKYLQDYMDYCQNENGNGLTCETSLCNYFTYLADRQYSGGSLWSIYSALNYTCQVKHGRTFSHMMSLKLIIKNLTKEYVANKANVFTAKDLTNLFETDLLDVNDPQDLEMIVGFLLCLFGLLRSSEILALTCRDVLGYFYVTDDDEPWEVSFDHRSKTRKTGFKYLMPAKYRHFFDKYVSQMKPGFEGDSRFLKNWNVKAGSRVQNLGCKKVNGWAKNMARRLGYSEEQLKNFTSHAGRRTAGTVLADGGVDMINLKRMGRWSSDKCVEGYIADGRPLKKQRMTTISNAMTEKKKLTVDKPIQEYTIHLENPDVDPKIITVADAEEITPVIVPHPEAQNLALPAVPAVSNGMGENKAPSPDFNALMALAMSRNGNGNPIINFYFGNQDGANKS